ncbi:MAG TPA: hypothetical protein VKX17_05890 [Planctomycetota bacterium]|nr:hypothetical protein [Planctomycetota bacterium]
MRRTVLFFIALTLNAADAHKDLPMPVSTGELPKVIDESSGLIKSKRYPGKDVFWTHNDSGDSARIFAIDSTGKLLRTVAIPHAENVDWEEITMDEKGRVIICDIGDNSRNNNGGQRMGVVFYRIAEPDAFDKNEALPEPEVFRFQYPKGEGPYDAEGVFARGGNAYLFSKQIEGASCFKLPIPEKAPAETVTMSVVTRTTNFNVVTGAALSDDGKRLALINYLTIMVIELPEPFDSLKPNSKGELPLFDYPRRSVNVFLGQTEGVAWDKDDLVLTTEGKLMGTMGGVFRCKTK